MPMPKHSTMVLVTGLMAGSPAVAHAEWESKTVAGVDTRIYTPAGESPIGEGRSLLVVLHGCSQTADQLQQFGNFELAAEEFGMVVALPNVPGGGVVAGCWNYYGAAHSRDSGHNGPVIALTEALRDDASYGLDEAQLYLGGFSAGGGQALIIGCLAPDLFAGVGVAAGPGLGTSVNDIPQVGTTVRAATGLCESLGAAHATDFGTQLAVAFTDQGDFTVAQGYAELNAGMFAGVYGDGLASMTDTALDFGGLEGASPAGVGKVYADGEGPRITWIHSMGVGHAWPSGSGVSSGGLTFVSGNGMNFSYYLAEFFTANARRADGDWNPGDDDGGSEGGGEGGGSEGGEGTDGGGMTSGGPGDDDGNGEGADEGAAQTGDDGDGTAGSGPGADQPEHIDPSGCQCRAQARSGSALGLGGWLVLMLGAWRRRKRS